MHQASIALREPAPAELTAGAEFVLQVEVTCREGCDLRTVPLLVTGPDGPAVAERTLALRAPGRVGRAVWTLSLPPDAGHAAGPLEVAIAVKPVASSMAVWAMPSPAIAGERFRIKVGAKSAAAAALAGCAVEICDASGALVGRGALGAKPWPGTDALHWTEIELTAPADTGVAAWSARFAGGELELPHDGASCAFSFAVVQPPEHTLTVVVTEKESGAPIEGMLVRLGAVRAATDAAGTTTLRAAKGRHDLAVWKVGYEAPVQTIEVTGDAEVRVAVAVVSEEDPDAVWKM